MHSYGYAGGLAGNPRAERIGVYDRDAEAAKKFSETFGVPLFDTPESLVKAVDAVIITSENKLHAEYGELAATYGKHILCEKPLVTSEAEGKRLMEAVNTAGVKLMTAFPCRYSPAFKRLQQRVANDEIGKIVALCTTNRGSCPFSWFVETEKSGGGAMIDHTVHVTDLLRALLKEEPVLVEAQIGNNMYHQGWEDTAMLTLTFESGIFASLDSSWSRPKSYKTWGDVTMNVVGERGVIELDMFGPSLDFYSNDSMKFASAGFGSNLDEGLVSDFLRCIEEDTVPAVTGFDGLQAARVAMAGYESARLGQPVAVRA